jgi:hypothetical protein
MGYEIDGPRAIRKHDKEQAHRSMFTKSINHKLQNIKDFNRKIFLFVCSRGFEAPVRGWSSLT